MLKILKTENLKLDIFLKQSLIDTNKISIILYDYVFSNSKRIRSLLLFLVLKSLKLDVNPKIISLAGVIEILHNASLIHDDIIDESTQRRNKNSLNEEYDNKFAVIAGDYLLCLALKKITSFKNDAIMTDFTNCLGQMLEAESNQYFKKNQIISIDEYIEKSKQKTASLFELAVKSGMILSEKATLAQKMGEFALNFGIAFQIQNDIDNVEQDFKNGTYTAPIIYLSKEVNNLSLKSFEEFKILVKSSDCIEKSKSLAKKYVSMAIDIVSFVEDNQYRVMLVELTQSILKG